jgi:hypothetical protein
VSFLEIRNGSRKCGDFIKWNTIQLCIGRNTVIFGYMDEPDEIRVNAINWALKRWDSCK